MPVIGTSYIHPLCRCKLTESQQWLQSVLRYKTWDERFSAILPKCNWHPSCSLADERWNCNSQPILSFLVGISSFLGVLADYTRMTFQWWCDSNRSWQQKRTLFLHSFSLWTHGLHCQTMMAKVVAIYVLLAHSFNTHGTLEEASLLLHKYIQEFFNKKQALMRRWH